MQRAKGHKSTSELQNRKASSPLIDFGTNQKHPHTQTQTQGQGQGPPQGQGQGQGQGVPPPPPHAATPPAIPKAPNSAPSATGAGAPEANLMNFGTKPLMDFGPEGAGTGGAGGGGGGAPKPKPKPVEYKLKSAKRAGDNVVTGDDPEIVNAAENRHKIKGVSIGGSSKAGKSQYVQQKMAEREQGLKDSTEAALAAKRALDAKQAQDQVDFDLAKQKFGAALQAWGEDNGNKRNLRVLLSTLHDVLWDGTRWREVSLGDLLDVNKVKRSYQKSMLVVHPDKVVKLGPEERFIAKRLFEALNEAYAEFLAKEDS